MAGTVGAGGTIVLTAYFRDGSGALVNPTTPLVDIINSAATQVVTDAVPTQMGTGWFQYSYAVPGAGPLGTWTAHWTGTINGVLVSGDDTFTVVAAGSINIGVITLGSLIEKVRLAARDKPPYDTVSGTYTTSTTAVTFASGVNFPVNTILDWYDQTFEASLVSAKSSTTVGTLVRAIRGTTAAAHSTGAQVLPNPRFLLTQYRDAINYSLAAIGTQFRRRLWQTSASFSSSARLVSVPAGTVSVFAVMEKPDTDTTLHPVAASLQTVPTSLVTSGKAVSLTGYNPGSGTAYIGYEVPWTNLTAWTDTLDAEYPTDAEDLIIEGAIRYLENPDIFARLAFTRPHVEGTGPRSGESSLMAAVRLQMATFFQRRQELAARQPPNFTWMKG